MTLSGGATTHRRARSFRLEVDDIEDTIACMKNSIPNWDALEAPAHPALCAYSAHDPDTNIFDLSQRQISAFRKTSMPKTPAKRRGRATISHIALRTATRTLARNFMRRCSGLRLLQPPRRGWNFYLSDGRVIAGVLQWKLSDYIRHGSGAPPGRSLALPWRMWTR